jgi:hypothetical protein
VKELLDLLHDIGWFSFVLFMGLVAIFSLLIAGGIIARIFTDIFMFGWNLL